MTTKIVFGQPDEVEARLTASTTSNLVNTGFVERENLTLRQHNRRLTRKTNGFSKELSWFEKQLWLCLAYYHLVVPHDSLKQQLLKPEPTRGNGSAHRWRLRTPAMAAGLTDHIWTTSELLSFRVPAWFLDNLHNIERLFPPPDLAHQGS